MANSRIQKQRQGSTNTEGYLAESRTERTPGKQTVQQIQPQRITTQAADDEGITITLRIPIDGIC